jgi:transcription initiation factor TFIIIB Brf1 subunit/transcription initiation factor TFIIB
MSTDQDDLWDILDCLRAPDVPFKNDSSGDDELVCEACGANSMVVEDGQNICTSCCTVMGRIIDHTAEWRYYGADDSRDEDPTRCGLPTNDLLPKSSLGSMIGGRRGESKDIRRIRMYQMWNSMPYWERSLYNVFEQLSQNTVNHGIPSKVLDDAKVLYKKASEKKISRGENKEGLIASCIYFACLLNKVPRSPKEVSRMFNIDPNVLTKGNARFQTLLQINVESSEAEDFISRFGSKLNMDYADIQKCKELAKKLDDLEIVSENAPTSVAAGTLYYYCMSKDMDYNKKQIADICEVSEVTITKCYKRLSKYKHLLTV